MVKVPGMYTKVSILMEEQSRRANRNITWPDGFIDLTLIVGVVDNSGGGERVWKLFLVGGGTLEVTPSKNNSGLSFNQFKLDIESAKNEARAFGK